MNISDFVGEWVANLRFADITPESVDHAKTCFMDWLGVCLAGSAEPAVRMVDELAWACNGPPLATLIGCGVKASPLLASLRNGVAGHVLDYDDVYPWGPGHPSSTVMPAALALAEARGIDGKRFITAVVAGFQVQYAVGEGFMPQHYERGWHNTGTLGHLGAAAACAKLLQLEAHEAKNALGIAATQASGLQHVFGSMCKSLHAGKAALDGLIAALLAQQGFTSGDDPLGGRHGFLDVFAEDFNTDKVVKALTGMGFVAEKIRFKLYPSCYSTHGVIECIARLKSRFKVTLDDVSEIECLVHPGCLARAAPCPATGLEAKFSTQFCAAVALDRGTVTVQDLTDEVVRDPRLIAASQRVRLVAEPSYEPSRSATVTLVLRDGRRIAETVSLVALHADRASAKELARRKFLDTVGAVSSPEVAEGVLAAIDSLEDAVEMCSIVDGLRLRTVRQCGGTGTRHGL